MEAQNEIQSIGVDWITATCADRSKGKRLAQRAVKILHEEQEQGNELKNWVWMGYFGLASGGCATGERHDGIIVRLSGPTALAHWREVYEHSESVSRLDVQVTVNVKGRQDEIIEKLYKRALKKGPQRGARPTVAIQSDSNGAATLYVGKRVSDRMGRLYNKAAESKSKVFEGGLRAEVETKRAEAQNLAHMLYESSSPERLVFHYVTAYYTDRLGRLAFMPGCFDTSQDAVYLCVTPARLGALRNKSDHQRSLRFLARCAGKTARRLVCSGMSKNVLDALGLEVRQNELVVSAKFAGPTKE